MPESKKTIGGKKQTSNKKQQRGTPPPPRQHHQQQYHHPPPKPPYQRVYRGAYGSYTRYPISSNDKLLAGFSYLVCIANIIIFPLGWIMPLIVLLAVKPMSPWLRFHTIQALVLNIVVAVSWVLALVLTSVLIGFCILPFVIALVVYVVIIGIFAFSGKDHRAPMVGNWVEENWI